MAINSTISDAATAVAQGSSPSPKSTGGTIVQTERLFTARSRAASTLGLPNALINRGQHAYIKVLTSEPQLSEYRSGSTQRDISFKQLLGETGDLTKASDTGTGEKNDGYDKFLLTDVSGRLSEKVQITEVFGDGEIVYYFGRHPMVFNLTGILIDSPDNSWFTDWLMMYSDVLRGTQTAKNYELIKLVLPNMILTGTIMGVSWNQNAARDVDIPFSFEFLAKVVEPIPVVEAGLPISNQIAGVNFSKAEGFTGQSDINKTKEAFAAVVQDPTSTLTEKSVALQNLGQGVQNNFKNRVTSTDLFKKPSLSSGSYGDNYSGSNSASLFQSTSASLNGIRTNLFSPIYGVLTSLTKIVANTQSEATELFNGVSLPIRNILRDVTNVSRQAGNLVKLVNSAVPAFGRGLEIGAKNLKVDYKTAIKSVSKTAGIISTAPSTASQNLTGLYKTGIIPANSPFLVSSSKTAYARPSLSGGVSTPVNKAALLRSIPVYSAATSNKL